MESLHKTVKELQRLKFSQLEISAQAGVSQMTISRWAHDEPRRVDTVALKRLTKFLEKVRKEKEGA
jgi:transcriptional regulator with XRE-family HTH domain